MNICIISPRYPYKDNMEFIFVKKLVDEWAKMGHRCVVVTCLSLTTYLRGRIVYKPKHYCYEVSPGNTVDVYTPRSITTKLKWHGVSLDSYIETRVIERQLNSINIEFDFIYCHFVSSALKGFRYAYKHNVPFYFATGESEIGRMLKPYFSFTWENFCSYTSGVVAVSSKNKNEAAMMGYINEHKCSIFPNATDTNLFRPLDRAVSREQLGLPQDAFIVSCVGSFCERKGQNRLLEAVRMLKKYHIKILFIGSDAIVESFKLEGDEILFKGTVENVELSRYLCASDIFCLPTLAEGCCNAIIEALACGLPVVSSNLSFNWDVLDETNSILVNPNVIEEISDAIRKLYVDAAKRNALCKGALLKAKKLDIKVRSNMILEYVMNNI